MSKRIVQSKEATNDLIDIALYYRAEDRALAERFLGSVDEDFRRIAEIPGIGTIRVIGAKEPITVRVWPVTGFRNYLIFYQAAKDEVTVLRVLHGARDVDRILETETSEE